MTKMEHSAALIDIFKKYNFQKKKRSVFVKHSVEFEDVLIFTQDKLGALLTIGPVIPEANRRMYFALEKVYGKSVSSGVSPSIGPYLIVKVHKEVNSSLNNDLLKSLESSLYLYCIKYSSYDAVSWVAEFFESKNRSQSWFLLGPVLAAMYYDEACSRKFISNEVPVNIYEQYKGYYDYLMLT